MMTSTQAWPVKGINRHLCMAGAVAGLHASVLWALHGGLLHRKVEMVVPAEIVVQFIEPATREAAPQPQQPPSPVVRHRAASATPTRTVQALPLATPDPAPTASAPVGASAEPTVTESAAAVAPAPQAGAPAVAAPPAPARVVLPSSDADYLQNTRPAYPAMSKRLGEQGQVLLRVLIEVDGKAQKAEIKTSSGYDRLDQAALATVLRWRYVPGKRAGVAEAMWFNVPINFVLE
jgi:periplasmic protein TonB